MTSSLVTGEFTDMKARNFIQKFNGFTFETYDEYVSTFSKVCIVRPELSRQEHFDCTCHDNAKEFTCKHSLGVAILRRKLVMPEGTKIMLLGRLQKRGRKRRAAPAWQAQPFHLHSPVAHVQQDANVLAGIEVGEALQANDDIVNDN